MKPLEVGVASWSLKLPTPEKVFAKLEEMGIRVVQYGPLLATGRVEEAADELAAARAAHESVAISALMVGWAGEDYSSIEAIHRTGGYGDPATAESRVADTMAALEVAGRLGVGVVSLHIGFVPADASEPGYGRMVGIVQRIGEKAADCGAVFAMETGQETAEELLEFLKAVDRPAVKINFDPANMILYGRGEPLAALRRLGGHVAHVHAKDATASDQPGVTWGAEVPLGTGAVDLPAFVSELKSLGYKGPLVIEREAGPQPFADIADGKRLLESLV